MPMVVNETPQEKRVREGTQQIRDTLRTVDELLHGMRMLARRSGDQQPPIPRRLLENMNGSFDKFITEHRGGYFDDKEKSNQLSKLIQLMEEIKGGKNNDKASFEELEKELECFMLNHEKKLISSEEIW